MEKYKTDKSKKVALFNHIIRTEKFQKRCREIRHDFPLLKQSKISNSYKIETVDTANLNKSIGILFKEFDMQRLGCRDELVSILLEKNNSYYNYNKPKKPTKGK
jgi:CRISPR/Cas system-associated endonuclease Cas3-HD